MFVIQEGWQEKRPDTYAPVSTVRWDLGRNLSLLPSLPKNVLILPTKPFDFGGAAGGRLRDSPGRKTLVVGPHEIVGRISDLAPPGADNALDDSGGSLPGDGDDGPG
jgi:hypothetical protein